MTTLPGIRRLLLAVLAIGLAMDVITVGVTVHTRTHSSAGGQI